jgi:hypothetical protein
LFFNLCLPTDASRQIFNTLYPMNKKGKIGGVNHSFNVNIAVQYGLNAAIMLNELAFLRSDSMSIGKQYHNKNIWIKRSLKNWCIKFPYLGKQAIRSMISELHKEDLIELFDNKDKTISYALTDLACEIMNISYDGTSNIYEYEGCVKITQEVCQNNTKGVLKQHRRCVKITQEVCQNNTPYSILHKSTTIKSTTKSIDICDEKNENENLVEKMDFQLLEKETEKIKKVAPKKEKNKEKFELGVCYENTTTYHPFEYSCIAQGLPIEYKTRDNSVMENIEQYFSRTKHGDWDNIDFQFYIDRVGNWAANARPPQNTKVRWRATLEMFISGDVKDGKAKYSIDSKNATQLNQPQYHSNRNKSSNWE